MSDVSIADAAPSAAPNAIPVEAATTAPSPVESSIASDRAAERVAAETAAKAAEVAVKPVEPKKSKDAGEAVRNAMAKVKADEAKTKAEPKPDPFGNALLDKLRKEAKAEPDAAATTDAKPPSKYQPPSRMADDAKQAWDAAPEPVQREVERMHRELSQGLEKYRASAERDHSLQQYHELARQGGKDLKSVVDGYWQAEQAIRRDPVAGLDAVCKNLGLSLRDVAAHVMGQPPDQQQSAQSAELHQLRQTVQQLQQHLGGVTQTIQQQRMAVVVDKINTFKSANPRYDELEADMVKLIEGGLARDLPDAYAKADRLNPAPARLQAHAEPAQTRESKSISGAPSAGSSPAARKPSKSIRDALQSASARAG